MRLIIGIIFGVLIVFNWSSIRDMFDSSIAKQSAQQVEKGKEIREGDDRTSQKESPQQPQGISGIVEQQLRNAADRK